MTKFIIVRHGCTRGTEKNRYYGRTDLPLSKSGISQARGVKRNMGNFNFDYIYTSPLKRCVETARILRLKKTTPVEISEDLIEIDFGDWEGLTLRQMKKKNPKKFNKYLYDFENFHMPGGESVKNMIRRTKRFWKNVLQRHKKGNILIVTHGGPAKVIIMDALGLPLENFWHLNIGTSSVSVIESYPSHRKGEGRVRGIVKGINLWARLS